ncbi:MAG TPA: S46 family peptidase [Xanthomonadaceae bacterium]|nr:S46 family peptidase [Xanthomonadaceae bacterium]
MRTFPLALLLLAPAAFAAEGMWTLDNLPAEAMEAKHGFTPDAAWVEKVMRSSVRLAGGCSGSFVSADALVLTNHHCVVGCVSDLSSKENDYVESGFLAREHSQEKVCPGFELNRLERITDVTARVRAATEGLTGKAYSDAKKAVQSELEAGCVGEDAANVRCDMVELYQGGLQHLYRYTRFQDVRLVFAPEHRIAFFGGDPDNFNFPRYNLDMGLLRAWVDGKPARIEHYFPFDAEGAQDGELVMVTGHPGSTQRLLTVAQLELQRDLALPTRLLYLAELRGLLGRYSAEDPEQARIAQTDLQVVENSFKALLGRLQALQDPQVFALKREQQAALEAYVAGDPERAARYGRAWDEIAQAQRTMRNIHARYSLLEAGRGFQSDLFGHARRLLRAAAERDKPNARRLREYGEAALPRMRQQVLSEAPIYPEYEKVLLAWSLGKLREHLGTDDAFVRQVLGRQSPEAVAARLVDGSRLADREVRTALWEGGSKAIAASQDPMIVFARAVDPEARAVRKRYEDEVEAIESKNAELLAQARFEQLGTSVYPDATFSLRLSLGEIRGWTEGEREIAPFTELSGLYERATGADPYALPGSWIGSKDQLDLSTRINQVSTNDIIGGNSGSPLIDRDARIVGLIFDGNIHSLGGAYWYDERLNRAVSVHPAAMLEALRKIYGAGDLAEEMTGR